MTTLSYLDEMRLTSYFLDVLRLRLSDKATDVLPLEGKMYDGVEPNQLSLVGCLGPQPDPNFSGPQPPNSLGMVLLVSPNNDGRMECRLSGQFDITHRYIPDVAMMARDLVHDSGVPRNGQLISMAFRSFTVTFDDVLLKFDPDKENIWVSNKIAIDACLAEEEARWRKDIRVMRRCRLNPNGGAKFNFEWSEEALNSQEGLNNTIYNQIIDKADEIVSYKVNIRGRIRPVPPAFGVAIENRFLLELYIENQTLTEDTRPFGVEFPYLLDTRMQVDIEGGQAHKVPHRLQPEDYRYHDDDGLPGYGISCGVIEVSPGCFATNAMPSTAQSRIDAPLHDTVGMQNPPHYLLLSNDSLPILKDFLEALERYLGKWTERIAALEQTDKFAERDIAIADRDSFSAEIARIRDGIDLLALHAPLRQCFQWMNEAMGAAIKIQGKHFAGWHLFQLGFILTQIRSIFERHANTIDIRGSMESADVLWFATGGGKTEAYLGIISMAMLYGRKMGRQYGTTAWMRFPLRMLSVQQFQRLSYVLAQSNIIRQREQLGGWPFTIGYYTGNGTPSRISSTMGDDARKGFLPALSDEQLLAYQFISDCPYCGLLSSIIMDRDNNQARLKHVCTSTTCWSNTNAEKGLYGEGIYGEIGIFVSDEECYRYLPSVLVGTVDKLAVIAHNKRFVNFFGGARFFCPEHGFSQEAKCEHRRIVNMGEIFDTKECGNNSRTSTIKTRSVPAMLDPGFSLLVQDELHLLKESLGNFDAHYESLLTALQIAHGGRGAKILAATATIKDFEDHIHHLYLKKAIRFPAPGVTQGESFYARKAKDTATGKPLVRRWFAGILPIGRGKISIKAVAEVSSRFLDQVDDWRTRLKSKDPILLGLIDIRSDQADEALAYIEKNLNTDLVYANSKRSISEIQRYLEEINGKMAEERGFRQLDGETRLDMILDAIHHVENKDPDDPIRHIIATSVVSHGVDIAELNFMVMAGWPKSTAEYIQASARCGRVHPGIVMCILSSRQLFELTVFQNFNDYHSFLERLVDSVPINRFAPNILGRTLPGIISAVLLNWAPQQPWGKKLTNKASPLVSLLKSSDGGKIANEIRMVIINALRVPKTLESVFDPRIITNFNKSLEDRVKNAMYELENWPPRKHDQSLAEALGDIFMYKPFRSFRDIENQIVIKKLNTAAERVLNALAR